MKAAAIDKFGPPSVLAVRNVPVPRPGPNEVVIAVHAAGVGIWDAQMRDGNWIEGDVRFPIILGLDGAGTIAEVGDTSRADSRLAIAFGRMSTIAPKAVSTPSTRSRTSSTSGSCRQS